jgi:TrmH RNA methyltransferase
MKDRELTLCGLPAVQARFEREAGSILRLYFDYATARKIGVMTRVLAQARKIYRCVEPAELEKIAGTKHHGGIVAVVRAAVLQAPTPSAVAAWAKRREPVLVLDRIGNAHNLGAIARTAAFLGVTQLVLADDPAASRPNDAAYRVSEGGLEQLDMHAVKDVALFLGGLAAAGYEVVGAATRVRQTAGGSSREGLLAASRPSAKPVALVLGNEEHGLAPAVERACTRLVTIPGSGRVESLNVSVAAAILLWELIGKR